VGTRVGEYQGRLNGVAVITLERERDSAYELLITWVIISRLYAKGHSVLGSIYARCMESMVLYAVGLLQDNVLILIPLISPTSLRSIFGLRSRNGR
jgi:hypothetical protein